MSLTSPLAQLRDEGARAATNAGDRISQWPVSRPVCSSFGGFSPRTKPDRFRRRRNVAIEYRWAEGATDRMVAMAAELVRRGVAVIVATGGAHHVLSRLGRQGSPRFRTIQVCPKDLPPALP
jgi:putative tryptophan/tyrosine transport system substrate-binding protein